jgi:hypothetical protein
MMIMIEGKNHNYKSKYRTFFPAVYSVFPPCEKGIPVLLPEIIITIKNQLAAFSNLVLHKKSYDVALTHNIR